MTRGERRRAIEKMFWGSENLYNSTSLSQPQEQEQEQTSAGSLEEGLASKNTKHKAHPLQSALSPQEYCGIPVGDLTNLTCSICISEYEHGERLYSSGVCDHIFHLSCILNWLERRSNTECPCCRKSLVSEDDVWETVKVSRKASKKPKKDSSKKKLMFGVIRPSERHAVATTGNAKRGETGLMDETDPMADSEGRSEPDSSHDHLDNEPAISDSSSPVGVFRPGRSDDGAQYGLLLVGADSNQSDADLPNTHPDEDRGEEEKDEQQSRQEGDLPVGGPEP
ncbi:zinc ion binding [Seminavis robusta]|uniref:Zinc ion binding n=1 Tax=Seminavis robusta TaxID=568900 RepID=A0A9N8EFL0_9STRA|nr:zinc ion binding [Seminavis robusta]|eukprot:Sro872_g213930.1 zinc ion binding (281) ;mRNA; f:19301-20267